VLGTNMYRQRFLAYIKGSRVPGLEFEEEGCRDASDPVDEKAMIIGHRTYFARKSLRWNGSPIFLEKNKSNYKCYVRMYLITEEQFDDFVAQENYLEKAPTTWTSLLQARQMAQKNGTHVFLPNAWYGTLLYLGSVFSNSTKIAGQGEGHHWPVFTFTHDSDDMTAVGPPSRLYLSILARGIRQMTGLSCINYFPEQQLQNQSSRQLPSEDQIFKSVSVDEIVSYFRSSPGVDGFLSEEELTQIVHQALQEEETSQVVDLESDLILENNFMCGHERGWPCY